MQPNRLSAGTDKSAQSPAKAPTGQASGWSLGFQAPLGALVALFKTGKHPDQLARDALRSSLQHIGLLDRGFRLPLADGSSFDVGRDGGFRLQNVDGSSRRAYETDSSNPLTAQVVAWVDPLAELLTAGNDKLKTDLAGYLANAALSETHLPGQTDALLAAKQNVIFFYALLGLGESDIYDIGDAIQEEGFAPQPVLAAYKNSLETLFLETE